MLFTSLEFFVFFPLALMLFAVLPPGKRWIWLLLASYGFYGALRPFSLVYLGALTLLVWGCGVVLAHTTGERSRRLLLGAGLVVVVGSLFAFKFYDFAAGELERLAGEALGSDAAFSLPRLAIATPVGYSLYAFSAI